MKSPSSINAMPKEVCCFPWSYLLDYIEYTPNFQSGLSGDVAIEKVLAGLINNPEFLIQDPEDPHLSYPVEERHLRDCRYWHSLEFSKRLMRQAANVIGGHHPLVQAGIQVGYQLFEVLLPNHFQLAKLQKIKALVKKVPWINTRFNRFKQPKVLASKSGYARISMNIRPEYKSEVIPHMCDWFAGLCLGGCKFTGAEYVRYEETECITRGDEDCIYEFRWVDASARRRFFIFLHSLVDPDYILKRDFNHLFLIDANLRLASANERQDTIIKERTAELEASQKQLIAQERILTEQHIAGGMAHEIRNALGAADMRLRHYNFDKTINENICRLQQIVDKAVGVGEQNEDDQRIVVNAVRDLFEDQQKLQQNLSSITAAVRRGLKITGQVLDYAKFSTLPSEAEVDVAAVIDDLVLSYGEQLAALGIKIKFFSESDMIVCGTETQLHIVFQNLILNARDAILEKKTGSGTIQINVSFKEDNVVVAIEDDGVGITTSDQSKIFYPFFTTKPNRGIGLGLSTCEKIVRCCNGEITCTSTVGVGTIISVRLAAGIRQ